MTHVPRRRWRIAALLGAGVLVSYFDRVNLSASHASLIAAFGISDIAFGYLSSAYNLTYWLCQLPIGVVLDRFGVRRVGRVATLLWSAATFGAAAAPNLTALFAARFLLGIGEAPTFPASAKAVGVWFPPHARTSATALFDSAAKLSSVIAIPAVGLVTIEAGWRWGFVVTGLVSLVYMAVFWRVYRDPEDDPGLTETERTYIAAPPEARRPRHSSASPLLTLVKQRKVLALALGFGAYNYVFYLLLTWLPSYFSFALHMDLMRSFLYTAVPWLLATICELAVGGWLVDFLIRCGVDASRVRRFALIAGSCCGLGILGAADAHTPAQALFWISLSISGLSVHAAVGWSLPSLIAGPQDVGKVGGIVNFSNQLSGICAPVATGYLLNSLHSYRWVFGVSAIYLLIGILGYVFLLGAVSSPHATGPAIHRG